MLILLPPSESAGRRRGRLLDLDRLSFPELTETRRQVAQSLAKVSAHYDAAAMLGVSPTLTAEIARNLVLETSCAAGGAGLHRRALRRPRPGVAGPRGTPPGEPLAGDGVGARRGPLPGRDRPLPPVDGGEPARRRSARQRLEA